MLTPPKRSVPPLCQSDLNGWQVQKAVILPVCGVFGLMLLAFACQHYKLVATNITHPFPQR